MVTVFISAFLASAAFEPIGIWYAAIVGFALFFRKLLYQRMIRKAREGLFKNFYNAAHGKDKNQINISIDFSVGDNTQLDTVTFNVHV